MANPCSHFMLSRHATNPEQAKTQALTRGVMDNSQQNFHQIPQLLDRPKGISLVIVEESFLTWLDISDIAYQGQKQTTKRPLYLHSQDMIHSEVDQSRVLVGDLVCIAGDAAVAVKRPQVYSWRPSGASFWPVRLRRVFRAPQLQSSSSFIIRSLFKVTFRTADWRSAWFLASPHGALKFDRSIVND